MGTCKCGKKTIWDGMCEECLHAYEEEMDILEMREQQKKINVPQLTFHEYVDKIFKQNYELAREELMVEENYYENSGCRAWHMATEWTQDEVANYVGKYLGQKWAQKQDAINKAFYD